ncbi:Pathogenesis-related protein PRMS [Nymphon striatum]|nr:Pathogenesis-related protein PRMS [Nymphon striatum]
MLRHKEELLNTDFKKSLGKIAYHAACHLRGFMHKCLNVITALAFSTIAIEAKEIPGIIDAHSKIRAQHNLSPLIWSSQLENFAQEWAEHLTTINCQLKHRPTSGKYKQLYGENLFWAGAVSWSDGRVEIQDTSADDVLNTWASEQQYYNHETNQCDAGEVCSHYTQLIWGKTTEVGCAVALCPN